MLAVENKTSPNILDAKCRIGRHLLYMANTFHNDLFVGFDIAQTGLNILKNQWKNNKSLNRTKLELLNLDMDQSSRWQFTSPLF